MPVRIILVSTILILLFTVSFQVLSEKDISIYQALKMAEEVDMGDFTSVIKIVDCWAIKGTNLHNTLPCELLINSETGLIISAKNITPEAIIIDKNTYEFSGMTYTFNKNFYKTDQIYNGLEIYRNDSHYFKMKQAIFIKNEKDLVAYFMTKGPGMTK